MVNSYFKLVVNKVSLNVSKVLHENLIKTTKQL